MRKFIARLLRDDEGQDLVEYVLLVSLIALAVAAAFPPGDQRHHRGVQQRRSDDRRRRGRRGTVGVVVELARSRCSRLLRGSRVTTADRTSSSTPAHCVFGLAALAASTSIRDALGVSYGSTTSGVQGLWDRLRRAAVVIEAPSIAVLGLGALAAAIDATTRRIPNALTFGASGRRRGVRCSHGRRQGLGWSVAGWIVGLLVFLPLFALRAMGGGDVKLLAAFGAWLGPALVCWVAVYGAIAGGLLALLLVLRRRRLRRRSRTCGTS